jgi:hypothetical protein
MPRPLQPGSAQSRINSSTSRNEHFTESTLLGEKAT